VESSTPADYLASINTTSVETAPTEQRGQQAFVPVSVRYSRDGLYLLMTSSDAIWVQDEVLGTAVGVYQNARIVPLAALSPDGEWVAFVDLDAANVEQIFIVSRRGGSVTQITQHSEGTIRDLLWAQG
jgi:Tol biopolymer transport system component